MKGKLTECLSRSMLHFFFFFLTCKALYYWSTYHVGEIDPVCRFLVASSFLDIGQEALSVPAPLPVALPLCDTILTLAKPDGESLSVRGNVKGPWGLRTGQFLASNSTASGFEGQSETNIPSLDFLPHFLQLEDPLLCLLGFQSLWRMAPFLPDSGQV